MTAPLSLVGPTPVPNAAGAIYTVPANTQVVVTRATITNITAGAAALTLWVVRSAGVRGNANIVRGASAAGQSFAAGPSEPTVLNELAGLVLNAGDAIHGLSDTANALNFDASGWIA